MTQHSPLLEFKPLSDTATVLELGTLWEDFNLGGFLRRGLQVDLSDKIKKILLKIWTEPLAFRNHVLHDKSYATWSKLLKADWKL